MCAAERRPAAHALAHSTEGRAMARCCSTPLWPRRGAQLFADQGRELFERSEFARTPRKASTAGCPQRSGGSRPVGSPFLGYFLLAKQKKVTRLPGRHPGSGLGTTARYESSARCPHPHPPPKREGARQQTLATPIRQETPMEATMTAGKESVPKPFY